MHTTKKNNNNNNHKRKNKQTKQTKQKKKKKKKKNIQAYGKRLATAHLDIALLQRSLKQILLMRTTSASETQRIATNGASRRT
jgi:hypothetical protein